MCIGKVSSTVLQKAWKAGAKCLKITPTTTKKVCGVPMITNHITGTQVVKMSDGSKCITLGACNRLSKILREGTDIVSYPKGHLFGGSEGLIVVRGKDAIGASGFQFLPKEFGGFVKMLKELAKNKV